MTTIGIPPATDTDVEDVVWALETATSLWKRNERVDAIVWLRRAAQAAGEAEHDDRALVLAREAAELSDWIAKNPMAPLSTAPSISSIPPNDSATGGVDDLLRIEAAPAVSMSAPTAPVAFMPMQIPEVIVPPAPNTSDLIPISEPSSPLVFQSVASERTSEHVVSGAEAHAGLLDPWSTQTEEEGVPAVSSAVVSSGSAVVSSEDYDDEVVTSAQMMIPPAEPAVVIPALKPKKPPPPPVKITPLPPADDLRAPDLAPDPMQDFSQRMTKLAEPSPEMQAAAQASPPPPAPKPKPLTQTMPSPSAGPPVKRYTPEATLVSSGVEPPKKELDLSTVDALTDLPDDAREELERGATIHRISREEEVAGFALAYIVEGEVDVAAQIVDIPAQRIVRGTVLKVKGTVAESVPLRLICATETAVVATWDAAQVEPAFKACPWVEDDLRASANKMQALVGVTLGPLADRLDATLRAQVTSRLELRELAEGDVIVEQGHAVKELCLVGQGAIELVKDGQVVGEISVGEFLFAAEIMDGRKASATARAGKGGALLL
ncbi:MAG TPA: cyclic nucleotide-binding domain-containing protein, partial [Polyangiaceae bacterium]